MWAGKKKRRKSVVVGTASNNEDDKLKMRNDYKSHAKNGTRKLPLNDVDVNKTTPAARKGAFQKAGFRRPLELIRVLLDASVKQKYTIRS